MGGIAAFVGALVERAREAWRRMLVKVRAIIALAGAAAALAALDTLTTVDLGPLGKWEPTVALLVASAVAWLKRETALEQYGAARAGVR